MTLNYLRDKCQINCSSYLDVHVCLRCRGTARGHGDVHAVDGYGGVETCRVCTDEGGEAGARDVELLEVRKDGDGVLPEGAGEEERVVGAEAEEEVEALLEHVEGGGELDSLELAGRVGDPHGAEEVERKHAGDEALLPPLNHAPRHRWHLVLRRRGGRGRSHPRREVG
jgi:hypothetical protein